jgi:hypothetical protein
MRLAIPTALVLALVSVVDGPTVANAQGSVGFQPVVSAFPNGIALGVTPVVSADRRYVRLGVQPQFVALTGFQVYTIPAAVRNGAANPALGAPGAGFPSKGLGPGLGPGYQVPRFDPSFQSVPANPPPGKPRARGRSKARRIPRP